MTSCLPDLYHTHNLAAATVSYACILDFCLGGAPGIEPEQRARPVTSTIDAILHIILSHLDSFCSSIAGIGFYTIEYDKMGSIGVEPIPMDFQSIASTELAYFP